MVIATSSKTNNVFGTRKCQCNQHKVLVAANVARLCRDRLLANRGRMPGFAKSETTKPGAGRVWSMQKTLMRDSYPAGE
jgi:ribosomal protein S14